jgi:hypothetical protein
MGHVAGIMRNIYNILSEILKERDHFEDVSRDERLMLK